MKHPAPATDDDRAALRSDGVGSVLAHGEERSEQWLEFPSERRGPIDVSVRSHDHRVCFDRLEQRVDAWRRLVENDDDGRIVESAARRIRQLAQRGRGAGDQER